jgi:anti-sigma regulatory factor (Ser/Thr protein kinase)
MAVNGLITVEERSQVAQVRREVVALAQRLSIDARVLDRLGLAVTEAATNLVKHANGGRILFAPLVGGDVIGVEVIALDNGPGMQNVAASMRDGYSTAQSPGLGLGSMSRLASNLDIYSQRGTGTVARFEVWATDAPPPVAAVRVGGVCVAKRGETVCGDAWSFQSHKGTHRLLLVDGLGHGPDAATAAHAALRIAGENATLAPAAVLDSIHAGLRSTRGAAAAVASMTPHASAGTYAGIGNIRGIVLGGQPERSLVSHNGTLGHQVRKFQTFEFAFPMHALLVMHSDGIATRWSLDAYPGLARHHPAVIAATIYRDHARSQDDATVVVLRNEAVRLP